MTEIDLSALYLLGDEDGGVGLNCRLCDREGLPLAYYATDHTNPYTHQMVPGCATIDELQHQARVHIRTVHRPVTSYTIMDSPKMLRETLCVAQARVGNSPLDEGRKMEHVDRLQRLIDECDRHRPIGTDGKHGDLHTRTCGCDS